TARYRAVGRLATVIFSTYFLYVPLLVAMGVRDWRAFIFLCAAVLAAIAVVAAATRWSPTWRGMVASFAASTVMVGAMTVLFGPFILVPSFAAALTSMASLLLRRRLRPLVIALGACGFLIPLALDTLGIVPS